MNALQHEKSPYLLQHAGNPVGWRTWGPSAFDAAVREDKPIFLSVGYSTCHWCHVMAHESFEDEAVAEAINRDFVPIKVDREERPDVDAVYMAACLAMNGSGGWPLTVLLTPDRKPFWAGLVFDEPRYLEAGERAAAFVLGHMTDENGHLLARWREGDAAHAGKLDDYAFFAWGLMELYAATFHVGYLDAAIRLADTLLADFFDEVRGGFYPYSAEGEQLITRTKEAYDGAMPSGNAMAALVLSRLARLTGEERFRRAKDLQFRYLSGVIRDYPAGHCFALLALPEELWPSAELICTVRELPAELFAFLRREPRLNLTVLVKTPENEQKLADLAPFTAAYPIPASGARYYLCRGGACQSPVDRMEALEKQMKEAPLP